ncbi:Cys-tRNA(Pro) deacylase [Marinomonas epiphytica]
MTPAIKLLEGKKVHFSIHEYQHDAHSQSYGLEAAQKLNLDPAVVFKTLLVTDEKAFFVAIVPVTGTLNLKKAANTFGVKKLRMADAKEAERLTGYLVGGISPLGQKKALITCLDSSAESFDQIYVSGGKRGLDIALAPQDLLKLCKKGHFSAIGEAK